MCSFMHDLLPLGVAREHWPRTFYSQSWCVRGHAHGRDCVGDVMNAPISGCAWNQILYVSQSVSDHFPLHPNVKEVKG